MTAGDARPEGPFLRTGDLGAVWNGELFITGRRKDILIICGRNIHAEDVEQSIEAAHPALQAGCGGVFGVDTEEGEEGIVALYEIERVAVRELDHEFLLKTVRAAVLETQGVGLHAALLVRTGQVPRSSSGKVQRAVCRSRYLAKEFDVLSAWNAAPSAGPNSDRK
jgi:acyl-CoA synthetase (AMP-forming)/AMP-acid ligase II